MNKSPLIISLIRIKDDIIAHKFVLGPILVIIFTLALFFIQISGVTETLTKPEYIEAGLNLADSLPTIPPSDYPKLVIVIDDCGQNRDGVKEMFDIPETLTFAVLPFSEKGFDDANTAYSNGHEIILHIPFFTNKVPQAWLGSKIIQPTMDKDEIYSYLDEAFEQIPFAIGLNNHIGPMGCDNSFTTDTILSYLSQKNKILIDSATSSGSASTSEISAYKLASLHNMEKRVLTRTFFLDGSQNPTVASVKQQIKKAASYAHEHGLAVVIGHVGTEGGKRTATAIKELLPWLAENNVHIVGASQATQ